MIQPIGNRPVTAPNSAARMARPAGIVKTKTATRIATTRAIKAATCALTTSVAISPSSTTTGMAAANVESTALPSGL